MSSGGLSTAIEGRRCCIEAVDADTEVRRRSRDSRTAITDIQGYARGAAARCLPDRVAAELCAAARSEGWRNARLASRVLIASAVAADPRPWTEPARDNRGGTAAWVDRLGLCGRTAIRAVEDLRRLRIVAIERRTYAATRYHTTPTVILRRGLRRPVG